MTTEGGSPFSADRAYRPPPANVEAEQALLAAILVNNKSYYRVSDMLKPEHFSVGVHARVYAHIARLIDRGEQATPVTLKSYFDNDEALKEVEGSKYLLKLARSVVTILNVADYGRQIVDMWKRRELVNLALDVEEASYSVAIDSTANDIASAAEQRLYEITEEHQRGNGAISTIDSINATLDMMDAARRNEGKILGVPSGIAALDEIISGFQKQEFYVIAGRPSMGKSLLANGVATAAARHFLAQAAEHGGVPAVVGDFSLEMRHQQETARRLSREGQINIERILRGLVTPQETAHLVEIGRTLGNLPIFIDDTPKLSIAELRSRARRLARRGALGLLIVDHLGLISPPRELLGAGENAQTGHTSKELKSLAKELDCPVVALSQLSREVEKREDKRPMLADLRNSGSIEQDADVVMFCYREHYYESRNEPIKGPREGDIAYAERMDTHKRTLERTANRGDIIISKNRMGRTGAVDVFYDGALSTFGSLPTTQMDLADSFSSWEPQ